jgi:DNA-binding GntR family transcriptional regulator
LNISRGPLREGLKELRAEGLVQGGPGRGSFVVALSQKDIQEVYELRAAIEGRAARILIQTGNEPALAKLEEVLRGMGEAAEEGKAEGVAKWDSTFHQELCRLSGNERLFRVYQSHSAVVRPLLKLDNERFYANPKDSWKEHKALLEAIRSGDVRRTEELLNDHLESAEQRLIEFMGGESE